MRPRIPIIGSVCPSIRPLVRSSIHWSVGHAYVKNGKIDSVTSSCNHFIMRTHRWPYGPCLCLNQFVIRLDTSWLIDPFRPKTPKNALFSQRACRMIYFRCILSREVTRTIYQKLKGGRIKRKQLNRNSYSTAFVFSDHPVFHGMAHDAARPSARPSVCPSCFL